MIKANVHPKVASMYLGHSSVQITLDRYGHAYPGADEALAGAMDSLFNAAAEPKSGVVPLRQA